MTSLTDSLKDFKRARPQIYMLVVPLLVIAVPRGAAAIVAYEGDTFPEAAAPPWERSGTLDADRSIESGQFVQHVELGAWAPPPGGEQDSYTRSLADFAGEQDFFVEFCVVTNGERSEIPGTAPCSVVLGGVPSHTGVSYHFTIARDQVRFIRDNLLPIMFVDIQPEVPHVFRLELRGTQSYAWFLDGTMIDSGLPEGAFPTGPTEVIQIRAKCWYLPNTTRWQYVRYGRIPDGDPADSNCDGAINFLDIDPFIVALFDADAYAQQFPACTRETADVNTDGHVDFLDIDPFIACLFDACP